MGTAEQIGAGAESVKPTRHGHIVAFYESDDFLADAVVDFLAPAVSGDESTLIIATARHRERWGAALDTAGLARAAEAEHRLRVLDADETLETVLVDGSLDLACFRSTVGEAFDRLAERGRPVRVVGEMVALLWERGEIQSALALEDHWNAFGAIREFAVLCVYPMRSFCGEESAGGFQSVCQRHSAITNEGYSMLDDAGLGVPAVVVLEREAPAAS